MDRLACVDLPALPVQILLCAHPGWRGRPVAVLSEDSPGGQILFASSEAMDRGIRPGLRYAAALALVPDLLAATVAPTEVAGEVAGRLEVLRRFSPRVEPDGRGTFWLDASGLGRLFPSARAWTGAILAALASWQVRAVVGFSHFATRAVASSLPPGRICLLARPDDEKRALSAVPLACLDLAPASREALERLAIRDLGALLRLPATGLAKRFGPEVARLRRLAAGDEQEEFRPLRPVEPVAAVIDPGHPESDSTRLLFLLKGRLPALLATLAERHQAVAALELVLDFGPPTAALVEVLRPAALTLEEAVLVDLLRLRLEALSLPAPVTEIRLCFQGEKASPEQLRLYFARPRRDPAAAAAALARLRAELGDAAVQRARLASAHLPEATFAWEPLADLALPCPQPPRELPLVRRILARPVPLPPQPHNRDDGWLLAGLAGGTVIRDDGPFLVSGGWWGQERSREVAREYHFAQTVRGDLLWVFYDRRRRRWFLQGRVE